MFELAAGVTPVKHEYSTRSFTLEKVASEPHHTYLGPAAISSDSARLIACLQRSGMSVDTAASEVQYRIAREGTGTPLPIAKIALSDEPTRWYGDFHAYILHGTARGHEAHVCIRRPRTSGSLRLGSVSGISVEITAVDAERLEHAIRSMYEPNSIIRLYYSLRR